MRNLRFANLLFFLLLLWSQATQAQLANDICTNAILLPDVTGYCSQNGQFTTEGALSENYPAAPCFTGECDDVWYKFVAVATSLNVNINGLSMGLPGGTIVAPQIALYEGTCQSLTNTACKKDLIFANILNLTKTGLVVGQTYYIRICATNASTGSFRLCINNFNPIPPPQSDCPKSVPLCDKSGFTVQAVTGAGADPNELDDADCFQTAFPPYETNSTWYVWTAANNGALTFTLTPSNPADDLDFIVYELPGGPTNCADKVILRCMAAGEIFPTSPCMGPTGLDLVSTDISNPPGCGVGTTDNFLAALDMTAGKTYALVVNNFTSTGNGFTLNFGNEPNAGQFVGASVAFTDNDPDDIFCQNKTVLFTDISTTPTGNIVAWDWNFGESAVPATSNLKGPHSVKYTTTGPKSVSLTVKTSTGCNLTLVRNFNVADCCVGVAIQDSFFIKEPACVGDSTGAIVALVKQDTPPYQYKWSNGDTTATISSLKSGTYAVTITDGFGCQKVDSVVLKNPLPFTVVASLDTITVFSSSPVELKATASEPDASYLWTSANSSQPGNVIIVFNTDTTQYIVSARSKNGCQAADTVKIFVKPLDYSLPNAFTPDGDGINDNFGVALRGFVVTAFNIFSRWGELVYDDPSKSWDGTKNGSALPADVYAYRIILKFPDGKTLPLSGAVTLIR